MEAFFFGASEHYLFGAYHPPRGSLDRQEGILLCAPFGQEYMRSHKSFCYLAEGLASCGYHVMRFDYRGQGDSSGDLNGLRIQDWQEDICTAIRELQDVAMVNKITLMGLRLGATLLATMETLPTVVSKVVLWDPIVDGAQYRMELMAPGNMRIDDQAVVVNGVVCPDSFVSSIAELSLLTKLNLGKAVVEQFVSHEEKAFQQLQTLLEEREDFHCRLEEAPYDWNYLDNDGGILWPIAMLKAIIGRFMER